MSAAPFVYRPDGRPDWGTMWTTFCDLALHGGPPHRGPEQALHGSAESEPATALAPALVAELRRGIWETTGLYSELGPPGWISVTCDTQAIAEWLGAAIALENVEARVDDERVLLPARPGFRLEHEVKSVITVLAKTHHYGAMHGGPAVRPRGADEARGRHGFRCASCGLDVQVSRPAAADLDATCPVDGSVMVPQGLVAARRGAFFRHTRLRVGVGGPGEGKNALIDALRRRYGRRRAVTIAAGEALEVSDPAIDLVLVSGGESGSAAELGAGAVDATIGVLDLPAVEDAIACGDGTLDDWRLLVVRTPGGARGDLSRLEEETRMRRGSRPTAFVDLATAQGVDVVVSWLQRELQLEPWRERVRPPAP